MPPGSTAAPETRTRMRGPPALESEAITSSTSTSKLEIVVPLTTDRLVHFMPERTSRSGIVGSAALAAGASARARKRDAAIAAERLRIGGRGQTTTDFPADLEWVSH